MPNEVQYSDYLQLPKILNAQDPISLSLSKEAHDEMLFIIIHQTYELWFKQILYEVASVNEIMQKPALNDNSPELQTVVHRLGRCCSILKILVHQIDVMETMTPMDFLDFRDLLRPASGFQSWQFKALEARLGLKYSDRYGQEYYISQLSAEQILLVKTAESEKSLLELVNLWLERMPFFYEKENWKNFESSAPAENNPIQEELPIFWAEYRQRYAQSLAEPEKNNLERFDLVFATSFLYAQTPGKEVKSESAGALSFLASRAALFIMLYRGYPILQLPFQLLTQLLEIDEQLSTWRYRHISMVHRMIGTRIGTGGSSGKEYLKAALDKHYIFKEIAQLTSFLIERRRLPALSKEMERRLGFAV
ncbi:MAG: tryptophan 2,3-dioxygenase [Chitinophagales bacterium]